MNLLIFCCLAVSVASGPLVDPGNVRILKFHNYNDGNGGFKYVVEQSDGSKSQAQGNLVKVVAEGKEVDVLVIEGSYSYVIDGRIYTVRYVADQNGYHPKIAVEQLSRLPPTILRPATRPPSPPPLIPRRTSPLIPRRPIQRRPLSSTEELIRSSLLGGSSGTVRLSRKRTREVALNSFFLLMNYIQEDVNKYQ